MGGRKRGGGGRGQEGRERGRYILLEAGDKRSEEDDKGRVVKREKIK